MWLAAAGLLLALLIVAFVYLVSLRGWSRLGRLYRHDRVLRLDARLSEHLPRFWAFVRRRFTPREWYGLALTVSAALVFLLLYLFALISEGWVEEEDLYALDRRVHQWIDRANSTRLIRAMRLITYFGDPITVATLGVVLAVFLLYRGQRWMVGALVLATAVGGGVLSGLKAFFGRSRPYADLVESSSHSFPSGHTFLAVTFYGFLIYLAWRLVHREALRIPITVALTLLIFLVGLSRVVLGVHWVSDVLGGFTVGLAWLVCSLLIIRALQAYRAASAPAAQTRGAPQR